MAMQIYAHRGSSGTFAEHTRAAYLQALADGADGVECDLRLTADGVLVLLHDDDVDRTSDGSGAVADKSLAELRGLDFCSWKGAAIPAAYGGVSEQLLTLDGLLDILSAAGRPVGLAIEFKFGARFDAGLVDATLEALGRRGWSGGDPAAGNVDVSFMSFHPDAVKYLGRLIPAGRLCQLLEEVGAGEVRGEPDTGPAAGNAGALFMRHAQAEREALLDDGVAHLAGPGVDYLRANPGNTARWLAAGRTFRVWTVDTAEDLHMCLDAGVAELTTNWPAQLRAMLAELPGCA